MTKQKTPYIAHVESNLKGGVDVKLGLKTLVVGPNGGGKDAVVQSVELAILGRVSDVAGKEDVGQGQALMALAPGRTGSLWAQADVDGDGDIYRWETRRQASGAVSRPSHVFPAEAGVWPLRVLRETLSKGSVAKQREMLLSVAVDVSQETIDAMLPGAMLVEYQKLSARKLGPPLVKLALVNVEANSLRLQAGRDIKSMDKLLISLGATAAVVTEADLKKATAYTISCKSVLDTLPGLPVKGVDVETAKKSVEQADTRLESIAGSVYQLQQQLAAIEPMTDEMRAWIDSARSTYTSMTAVCEAQAAAANAGTLDCCGVCGQDIEAQAAVTRAAEMMEAFGTELEKLDAREAGERQRAETQANLDEWLSAQTQWTTFRDDQKAAIKVTLEGNVVRGARGEASATWQEAVKAEATLKGQIDGYEGIRRARNAKARAEEQRDTMKRLVKACEGVSGQLLDTTRSAFIRAVNKFLPDTDSFELRLQDSGKEICEVGLVRDGVLHTALSGAEWSRVTMAMACAMAKPGKLNVIIPEERAYDGDTLHAMMKALTDAPAQILITSPIKPRVKGGRVKGWKIIEVNKLRRSRIAGALGEPNPLEDPVTTEQPTGQALAGAAMGVPPELPATAFGQPVMDSDPRPTDASQWTHQAADRTEDVLDCEMPEDAPVWTTEQRGRRLWTGVREQGFAEAFKEYFPNDKCSPDGSWQPAGFDQKFTLFPNNAVLRQCGERLWLYAGAGPSQ